MNTRGLTEIVILTVGLQLKILDGELFSLMVVMALVTTVMAGPLLAVIYPKRRIARDIAEAEKAALGVTDAYRVFVVVQSPTGDTERVRLGADLAADLTPAAEATADAPPPRSAEVVVSHLLPYRAPGRLEVGAGLSGELLELTRVMGELEQLARPVRARGLAAPVLARFSADPAAELPEQVSSNAPDVLVVAADQPSYQALRAAAGGRLVTIAAALPVGWDTVAVRVTGGADGEAAIQVAAQIAAARGIPLVLVADARAARRLTAAVEELTRHGVPTTVGALPVEPTLLVAADGDSSGAQLLVRERPDSDPVPAAQWVPLLPRSEVVPAPQS